MLRFYFSLHHPIPPLIWQHNFLFDHWTRNTIDNTVVEGVSQFHVAVYSNNVNFKELENKTFIDFSAFVRCVVDCHSKWLLVGFFQNQSGAAHDNHFLGTAWRTGVGREGLRELDKEGLCGRFEAFRWSRRSCCDSANALARCGLFRVWPLCTRCWASLHPALERHQTGEAQVFKSLSAPRSEVLRQIRSASVSGFWFCSNR